LIELTILQFKMASFYLFSTVSYELLCEISDHFTFAHCEFR